MLSTSDPPTMASITAKHSSMAGNMPVASDLYALVCCIRRWRGP
jgi:hypothetical protein